MKNKEGTLKVVNIIALITLFSPLILENIFLNNIALYIEQRVSYFTSVEVVSNMISSTLALLGILLIIYSIILNKSN